MKILNKTIWAITPEMMGTMADIARESRKTCDAIAREMGKDMKDANAASIRDGVAVIKVSGPLFRYANLMTRICGATSYELLAQDFNKAVQNPNIKGILLDIDSPGGEVNGCSELSDMIYQARGTKPIIAYASGACCSGAYWIASACDKILAADTAILGSIGVVSVFEKTMTTKRWRLFPVKVPTNAPTSTRKLARLKFRLELTNWRRFLSLKSPAIEALRRLTWLKTLAQAMFRSGNTLFATAWRTAYPRLRT